MRISIEKLRINPLGILSAVFMILAPFGAWMTLSAFGYTSQSNLFEIIQSQTSFPIAASLASIAVYSSILLIIAGLIVWKRPKVGVLLASASVVLFGVESYSTFGMFSGPIPVSILPGIGFFLGFSGIVIGIGSLRTVDRPVMDWLAALRTRLGLGEVGIVVESTFLAADGWTHWSNGALSGFLGAGILEGTIHRAFFVGVAALLLVFLVNKPLFLNRSGGMLVLATFCALLLDVVYHFTTGSVTDFVGHDATEVLVHALSYYGVVSLVIARFLFRQR
jgi:hypothetical protein